MPTTAPRPLRVAMVIDVWDDAANGAVISTRRFTELLRERGHTVTVLAGGAPAPGKIALPPFAIPLADGIMRKMRFLFAWPDRGVLAAAFAEHDLVHVQMPFYLGVRAFPPLTARGDPRTFKLTKTTELGGFVGGVGLTSAAGWRDFFLLADFNFSQTDIGFDNPFRALIGTVRAGWNGKVLDTPLRLWVGGSYWGTKGTAKATVEVPDVGSVTFAAVQGPLHPLNALIGGNVTLFRRWEAFVEYGFNFNDVQTVAAGLTFRF